MPTIPPYLTPLPWLLALGSLATTAVAAQVPAPVLSVAEPVAERPVWRASPADSTRALSAARSAQSRFELIRRNHLPWTWDRGGGPCDERIGRFCLWYGGGEDRREPAPEPEPVSVARHGLIARLDTAAALVPGDAWIAGQRVRYLVEAARSAEAVAAARACRAAEPGWCPALLGYALHHRGEHLRADSAFAAALAAMPARARERWTDLSPLLEPGDVRAYRRLGPDERAAFEARFWWLADPLYMLPGNDRRTEHLARHVLDRLQERARQTDGISWGSDLRELLLRYGWPAGWERIRPRMPTLGGTSMITRYARGSRSFDPLLDQVRDPLGIAIDGWDLERHAARTGYAPAYAEAVEDLEFQHGAFRRADSVRVVAAFRLPPDSTGERPTADAAMILWPDVEAAPRVLRGRSGGSPAVLTATVAAEPTLMGLELFAPGSRRAARTRFALALGPPPAHGLSASDLLLLDPAEPLPGTLDEALRHLRSSSEARPGERIALYWEVYGLDRAELPVAMEVRLLDENAGWLRRVAVRSGILRQRAPLSVRWREAPDETGAVHARSAVVELPELAPGTYTLELTLTPRGREPLRARRTLAVPQ